MDHSAFKSGVWKQEISWILCQDIFRFKKDLCLLRSFI